MYILQQPAMFSPVFLCAYQRYVYAHFCRISLLQYDSATSHPVSFEVTALRLEQPSGYGRRRLFVVLCTIIVISSVVFTIHDVHQEHLAQLR